MSILKGIGFVLMLGLLVSFSAGFYVGAKYTDNQIGMDSLQKVVDSLKEENFAKEVNLGRWEVTMDWYKDENPKEAKKIEKWKSRNTE